MPGTHSPCYRDPVRNSPEPGHPDPRTLPATLLAKFTTDPAGNTAGVRLAHATAPDEVAFAQRVQAWQRDRQGRAGLASLGILLDVTAGSGIYLLRPENEYVVSHISVSMAPWEVIGDEVRTPFALATHYEGDTVDAFDAPVAESDFEKTVLGLIPSPNLMYAIRIDGRFSHVRARSVPKTMNYMPLADIAKLQTVFEFKDVEGTIVGFYTPTFLSGVHLAGLHLHFITADRRRGGHLLAAAPNGVTVGLQHAPSIELGLPMTLDFLTMESTRDMEADLHKVER